MEYCLNGVHLPYRQEWLPSEVSRCFPPEVLHIFHHFWYDHGTTWCVEAVGADEINFCFSILQPIMDHHHFSSGIIMLKQVIGKIQHDLQQYMIAVIAGAALAGVIWAICALLEVHYLTQASIINDEGCQNIAGAHHGGKRNILKHWQILKLELMQNIMPSICHIPYI